MRVWYRGCAASFQVAEACSSHVARSIGEFLPRKSYYKENKERLQKYAKEYYLENKTELNKKAKKYRDANLHISISSEYSKFLEHYYQSKYGISYSEYEQMVITCGNKCQICNQEEKIIDKRRGKLKRLAVDHCHETGKVRGLLCFQCNRAIGGFKDDIKLLESAIKYLKEHTSYDD